MKTLKLFFILFLIYSKDSTSAITLTGKVTSLVCKEKNTKLWISEQATGHLYYQAEVPLKSSFQVNLIPGKYKVVVNDKNGCFAEEILDLKQDNAKIQKEFVLILK